MTALADCRRFSGDRAGLCRSTCRLLCRRRGQYLSGTPTSTSSRRCPPTRCTISWPLLSGDDRLRWTAGGGPALGKPFLFLRPGNRYGRGCGGGHVRLGGRMRKMFSGQPLCCVTTMRAYGYHGTSQNIPYGDGMACRRSPNHRLEVWSEQPLRKSFNRTQRNRGVRWNSKTEGLLHVVIALQL